MKFLNDRKHAFPAMVIRTYEVWYDTGNAELMSRLLRASGTALAGVPVTFIHDRVFTGFTDQIRDEIEKTLRACSISKCVDPLVALSRSSEAIPDQGSGGKLPAPAARNKDTAMDVPLLGRLDAEGASLPVMTLIIAGLDSFNPCAFFVLLSLLGLLVHARSRNRMLIIGGVFVFFSGLIYFLFMAAWLNLFLVMGQVAVITAVAAGVALAIAAINIKDFFALKRGISLTIPDAAKPRLFDRMRRLMRSTEVIPMLAGTTVLATVANSYELLCTAGFPMVFTRILTLRQLPASTYYAYLALYNIIYIIPLAIIVIVFTITLGSRKLSEWQGRVLKLVSGTMMLGLGVLLLVAPAKLNSVVVSLGMLFGTLAISLLIAAIVKRYETVQGAG